MAFILGTNEKATEVLLRLLSFIPLIATVIAIVGLVCFFVGLFFSTIIVMYAQAALYRQAFSAGIQDPLLVEDTNVVVS